MACPLFTNERPRFTIRLEPPLFSFLLEDPVDLPTRHRMYYVMEFVKIFTNKEVKNSNEIYI